MISQFFSTFTNTAAGKDLLTGIEFIVSKLTAEFVKDVNARDAAIDSIIDYLTSIKTQK